MDWLGRRTTIRNMVNRDSTHVKPTGPRLEAARVAAGYRTAKEFSDTHGIPQATYNLHESGRRGLKLEVAVKYATILGCDAAWLLTGEGKPPPSQTRQDSALKKPHNPDDNNDQPVSNVRYAPAKSLDQTWINRSRVPLMGTGMGGDDGSFEINTGEPIDWKPRPPKAEGSKIYCIYLEGNSMEPRIDAGELLFVDPHRKPVVGRDCVVELHPTGEGEQPRAFVKQIVAINSEFIEVKQFNPEKKWKIKRKTIRNLHVILKNSEMY